MTSRSTPLLAPLALVAALSGCAGTVEAPSTDAGTSASSRPSAPASSTAPSPSTTATAAAERVSAPAGGPAVALARGPRQLASRLAAAEGTVRSQQASEKEVRRAAFETQVLYRQLARRSQWLPVVLPEVPARLRPLVRSHVAARQAFRRLHQTLTPTLPAWRIVPPAPADELLASYREGERVFGVPWEVLAAINLVETGMGRIRGTSYAGAQGPMQFMPATWEAFGRGDVNDPHDAILAAARYLAHNGGGRGDVENALYRYNNHAGYVAGVQAYASILERDPAAFRGLYHWQVLYLSTLGDVWLPVGYRSTEPVPVRAYVERHPERHLGTSTR